MKYDLFTELVSKGMISRDDTDLKEIFEGYKARPGTAEETNDNIITVDKNLIYNKNEQTISDRGSTNLGGYFIVYKIGKKYSERIFSTDGGVFITEVEFDDKKEKAHGTTGYYDSEAVKFIKENGSLADCSISRFSEKGIIPDYSKEITSFENKDVLAAARDIQSRTEQLMDELGMNSNTNKKGL